MCTDNYPLNVRLYKCFSADSKLRPKVQHPCNPQRNLILFFDILHIIKSIRNNWLRQMSGSHYQISFSQILKSERRLQLSNILKVFNLKHSLLLLKALFPLKNSSTNLQLQLFNSGATRYRTLSHQIE